MNIFILSLITFLIPVGVLAVGLLEVYGNRNTGLSRTLFAAFLFSLLSFFLFNLMTEVEMGGIQIIGLVILMPLSMLAAPLMLMYHKTLMGFKSKLLGTNNVIWNFIPFIYSIIVILIGLSYFSVNEVNDIFISQRINSGDKIKIIARLVLISAHALWYLQLGWYSLKVKEVYDNQKRKFGKFYAQYEERNEKLMNREVIILLMVGVYDLMFWVVRIRHPYLLILVNISFGVILSYLILSGKEQIDIKRYRMYKLDSHKHELGKKNDGSTAPKMRRKKTA